MKGIHVLALGLATLLAATAAHAQSPPRDDTQAPRTQAERVPRDRQDDLQAPRGQDEVQAPRGAATPAQR